MEDESATWARVDEEKEGGLGWGRGGAVGASEDGVIFVDGAEGNDRAMDRIRMKRITRSQSN